MSSFLKKVVITVNLTFGTNRSFHLLSLYYLSLIFDYMRPRRQVKKFCAFFFGIVGRKSLSVSGGAKGYGERDVKVIQSREVDEFCAKVNMIFFVAFLTNLSCRENPLLYGQICGYDIAFRGSLCKFV